MNFLNCKFCGANPGRDQVATVPRARAILLLSAPLAGSFVTPLTRRAPRDGTRPLLVPARPRTDWLCRRGGAKPRDALISCVGAVLVHPAQVSRRRTRHALRGHAVRGHPCSVST